MTKTIPTVHEFAEFGFERKILSERIFNVICVTKRNPQLDIAHFHLPLTGEAKVTAMLETASNGVSLAHTEVSFQGKNYSFSYVRNGLSGDALVIGIYNLDDSRYTEWELYTDTPSAKSDDGTSATSESLRQEAQRMCAFTQRRGSR